tara:strand:+ start:4023 stop:4496 length:474 start_codon:yes stop_codon:yes gene_type:complete
MMIRVFFAHPSSMDQKAIEVSMKELRAAIERKFLATKGNAPAIRVVSGRNDHARHWKGDWERWQSGVLSRKDSMTGQPLYSMFVTIGDRCGRATASILRGALSDRPVFTWDGERLCGVSSVEIFDEEDWTTGFRIQKRERKPKQLQLFGDNDGQRAI